MTFEQAFSKIKEKFNNADASGVSDFAISVHFTDEDCHGTFYAEVKNGFLTVEPYYYEDHDAFVNITKSALLAYLAGRSTLNNIIANGSASVAGDASKLADWKATIKKASSGKTTEKKAPAKKTQAKRTAAKKAPAKKSPAKRTEAKAETPAAKPAAAAPAAKVVDTTSAKPETKSTVSKNLKK